MTAFFSIGFMADLGMRQAPWREAMRVVTRHSAVVAATSDIRAEDAVMVYPLRGAMDGTAWHLSFEQLSDDYDFRTWWLHRHTDVADAIISKH